MINFVDCGYNHSAFIANGGFVYTMGSNEFGKLGIGKDNLQNSFSPCLVESLSKYKAITVKCGNSHTAVVVDSGEVFSWGCNKDG